MGCNYSSIHNFNEGLTKPPLNNCIQSFYMDAIIFQALISAESTKLG